MTGEEIEHVIDHSDRRDQALGGLTHLDEFANDDLVTKMQGASKTEFTHHGLEKSGFYILSGKRLFDVGVATIGLAILSPLFLLVIVAIKLSSRGSIFYRQERIGKNGQSFLI